MHVSSIFFLVCLFKAVFAAKTTVFIMAQTPQWLVFKIPLWQPTGVASVVRVGGLTSELA